jgi:hypothetical protein
MDKHNKIEDQLKEIIIIIIIIIIITIITIIIICPLSILADGISIMALNSVLYCTSLYESDMKVSQVCFAAGVYQSRERDGWINEP